MIGGLKRVFLKFGLKPADAIGSKIVAKEFNGVGVGKIELGVVIDVD